ncbi:MAG: L,D-transpeptidase [Cyanobacteriota bacterium]|nr:L,D-transpeptidase [Cyanobacteriota bacterium]
MTAWISRQWRSRSLKLFGSSAAVFMLLGQVPAIASGSAAPKTYPVIAVDSNSNPALPKPIELELELPPVDNPADFLPEEVPPEPQPEVRPQAPAAPEPPEATTPVELEQRLVLNLSDRRVYLYEGEKVKASYPVAVGKPGWETPTGEFSVLDMALDPVWQNPWTGEVIQAGPDSPIGPAIIVFLLDETGMFAFHGTPNEELIGQAVSHGCVRLRNEDILALYEQVDINTPVAVVP